MKTFKVVEVTIPDHVIKVELTLDEFKRLAEKQDFTPVFESQEIVFYIIDDPSAVFYAKKVKKQNES